MYKMPPDVTTIPALNLGLDIIPKYTNLGKIII